MSGAACLACDLCEVDDADGDADAADAAAHFNADDQATGVDDAVNDVVDDKEAA